MENKNFENQENQDYKVKQIQPAHADHISYYNEKFLNKMFNSSCVVAQRKYDGERMLIHFNGKETYCTSRRVSKSTNRFMENQDKIKNLPTLEELGYTVIDCECYGDTWADAVGILHSLPDRALQLQENTSIHFAVFDCLFFDGVDIRDLPYETRLGAVLYVLDLLKKDETLRFHFVDQFKVKNIDDVYKLAKEYWDEGKEGIVVKPLTAKYYDKGAMLKVKRFETVDVVVCGYQEGRGKYEGLVGALYVGYYDRDNNNVVRISKVNCGTDEDRKMWKQWFDDNSAIGKVIEVKCQEVTDKSLRHPVYIRLRDDKTKDMCTKETIFKE